MHLAVRAPVSILSYHQTYRLPPWGTPGRSLVVSPQRFERQMRALHARGWRCLSLQDLGPYLRGEQTGRVVGLTFDDGYLGNFQHALPVLRTLDFTATMFVVSSEIGGSNRWDIPLGVPQQPLMGLSHLREWIRAGMEVGAHTVSHPDLTAVGPDRAHQEIVQCRSELQAALDHEVRSFCYPYGRHDADHVARVQAAGYDWAVTTYCHRACAGADSLQIPRITVWANTPLPLLLARATTGLEDRRRALARALRRVLTPRWRVPVA